MKETFQTGGGKNELKKTVCYTKVYHFYQGLLNHQLKPLRKYLEYLVTQINIHKL